MSVITRKQYMDTGNELFVPGQPQQSDKYKAAKEQIHHDYYSQFVTEATIRHVLSWVPAEKLTEAIGKDRALNTIPIKTWDQMTWSPVDYQSLGPTRDGAFHSVIPFNREVRKQADSYGVTRSDLVCIAKAAARIAVEREHDKQASSASGSSATH